MFSVIIPTLGTRKIELKRLLDSLEAQKQTDIEAIIVSQDNHDTVADLLKSYPFEVKHVRLNRKGLSYARNEGLKYATGDYLSFSDDDCWYTDGAFDFIHQTLEQETSPVVCFQIFDPIKKVYYKSYSDRKEKNLTKRMLFNRSSIEIFINCKVIPRESLTFDENFGLGATYPSGEENIFLFDLVKRGYSISYEPEIVVYHEKPELSTRLTDRQIIGKGPMFKRLFNTPLAIVLSTLFIMKKREHLKKPFPLLLSTIRETLTYKQ